MRVGVQKHEINRLFIDETGAHSWGYNIDLIKLISKFVAFTQFYSYPMTIWGRLYKKVSQERLLSSFDNTLHHNIKY
jgi:hypothetical protein